MDGELLTRWTARLLVACWASRVLFEVARPLSVRRQTGALWAWTLGCGVYLLHVAVAFAVNHAWSHQAAWEHTARRTSETIGIDWGGGVYFNYVACVLWPLDVLLGWWSGGPGPKATAPHVRRFRGLTFAYVTFLVLNATIVFGPPFWKWAGAGFSIVLAIAVVRARGRRRLPEPACVRAPTVPVAPEPPCGRH